MITTGQKLPLDLPLSILRGGAAETTTLGALLDRRLIVSVYMRNNTSACDRQIASLANQAEAFEKLGYGLLAISRDSCASHAKYAAKQGVGFLLGSDPEDLFSKAADAIVEKSMYGKKYQGPARAAYVIDTDGTVLQVFEKVDTKDHAAQLLAALRA